MLCERCKKDVYKHETCNYCSRKICISCMKSSRKLSKISRIVICKDCWSNIGRRKIYKSAVLT